MDRRVCLTQSNNSHYLRGTCTRTSRAHTELELVRTHFLLKTMKCVSAEYTKCYVPHWRSLVFWELTGQQRMQRRTEAFVKRSIPPPCQSKFHQLQTLP